MAVMVFSWSITNPGIMPAIMGLGLGVSGWVLGHAPGAYRTFLPRVMGEEKDCPGSPLGLGRSLPLIEGSFLEGTNNTCCAPTMLLYVI